MDQVPSGFKKTIETTVKLTFLLTSCYHRRSYWRLLNFRAWWIAYPCAILKSQSVGIEATASILTFNTMDTLLNVANDGCHLRLFTQQRTNCEPKKQTTLRQKNSLQIDLDLCNVCAHKQCSCSHVCLPLYSTRLHNHVNNIYDDEAIELRLGVNGT